MFLKVFIVYSLKSGLFVSVPAEPVARSHGIFLDRHIVKEYNGIEGVLLQASFGKKHTAIAHSRRNISKINHSSSKSVLLTNLRNISLITKKSG